MIGVTKLLVRLLPHILTCSAALKLKIFKTISPDNQSANFYCSSFMQQKNNNNHKKKTEKWFVLNSQPLWSNLLYFTLTPLQFLSSKPTVLFPPQLAIKSISFHSKFSISSELSGRSPITLENAHFSFLLI